MSELKSLFFSMTSAVVLLVIFAIGSGAATIIESYYDTKSAWAAVYGASWFALVQVLLGINLAYNIFRYNLLRKEKLPVLIFHVSFLFMLLGAAMTRYLGFEGNIHIRENETSNAVFGSVSRIEIAAEKDGQIYSNSIPKQITSVGSNDFNLPLEIAGKKANLTFEGYYKKAETEYYEAEKGEPLVRLAVSSPDSKEEISLQAGETREVGGVSFAFDAQPLLENFVKIELKEGKFYLTSNQNIGYFTMATNEKGEYEKDKATEFLPMQLYTVTDVNFVPKSLLTKAAKRVVSKNGEYDALVANLTFDGQTQQLMLYENSYIPAKAKIDGVLFNVYWGSKMVELPFSLKLEDFELKRYPGSNSPMSYSSDVIVEDSRSGNYPYKIYMNHVLDHDGYRFFQSSYDQDELGTVLSVNRDPGKIPTYIGYFLLGLGLFFNVVNPRSRFRKLAKMINEDAVKKVASFVLVVCFAAFAPSKTYAADNARNIDANHAKELSTLIIQSADGRMKPFDTVAREILNKIHRDDTLDGLNANQAILSIMVNAPYWRNVPIIYVGNKELKKLIGIDEKAKYASFNDFFTNEKDGKSIYKLAKFAEAANRKTPGERGTFDKDLQKVDERLNILYMVFVGEVFTMFPRIDDPNNTWYAPASAMMYLPKNESEPIGRMLRGYFTSVAEATENNNWRRANQALAEIKTYQQEHGKAVMPGEKRIEMELFFNEYKIFESLTPIYLLTGLVLLCFVFAKMARPKLNIKWLFSIVYGVNILAFLLHTFGIGIRWYIAEHAPWSNAYESMVYIAWALSLSGLVFSRQSPIAMALTSILAGVTLFVAHLSWMDPQITTLVPVLQSYWLTIHVSVITASYGFLGLCSLLGMFTLVLFAIQGGKEHKEISRNILEATRINEMAMILGLSLLTMGNFLGGVWANESWGRYWGWDSKETWALVSILVYAAVLHIRFIPKLNSQYAFAVTSMFAYWSIIMTYFGVNFYLSGMHSYAAGEPIPVPTFVWIGALLMVLIAVLAYFRKPDKTIKL